MKQNPYTLTKRDIEGKKQSYLLGLIRIDPMVFLKLTTSNDVSSEGRAHIERIKKEAKSFEFYDELHKKGDIQYPFLTIKEDGRIRAHEGRHRAYAAFLNQEEFYCHLLPHSSMLDYKIKEDIIQGNGEKYIPSVLKNQFDGFYQTSDFDIVKEIEQKSNPESLSNTEKKLLLELKEINKIISIERTKLVAAARRLESLGLVTIIEEENDHGYKWLKIKEVKSNPERDDSKPFHNCRTYVQMITGVSNIESLPVAKKSFKGAILWWGDDKMKSGQGGYRHVAIDNGDGTMTEVEEWGGDIQVSNIKDVEKEYGPIDRVYDPRVKSNPVKSSSSIKKKFLAKLSYDVGPLKKGTIVKVEYSDAGIQKRYVLKKGKEIAVALLYDRGEKFDHEVIKD